jgi:hypothetical protein
MGLGSLRKSALGVRPGEAVEALGGLPLTDEDQILRLLDKSSIRHVRERVIARINADERPARSDNAY